MVHFRAAFPHLFVVRFWSSKESQQSWNQSVAFLLAAYTRMFSSYLSKHHFDSKQFTAIYSQEGNFFVQCIALQSPIAVVGILHHKLNGFRLVFFLILMTPLGVHGSPPHSSLGQSFCLLSGDVDCLTVFQGGTSPVVLWSDLFPFPLWGVV